MKYRKRKWRKKCEELIISLSVVIMKKGKKEKESKISERRPKSDANFVEVWEVALSLSDYGARIG